MPDDEHPSDGYGVERADLPVEQPGGEPATETLPVPEPVPPGRRPLTIVGLVIGIAALIGAAVFAAFAVGGDEGSPESAVNKLIDAVNREDVLGAMEALPPGERDSLKGSVSDLSGQLERLEILSSDFDLSGLKGIVLDISDAKFSSQKLSDDVAMVSVVGGRARSSVDPAKLPLGDFVRKLAGDALTNAKPTSDTEEIKASDPTRLATIKEDSHWYVSLWYSVAEAARRDAGARAPDFGHGIPANGASSPEQAVDGFLRAGAALDLRQLIELLPPDEMRALHDYAPLFLDDAQGAINEFKQRVQVSIDDLGLSADRSGDRALVKITKFGFTAKFPSDFLGDSGGTATLSYGGGCITFSAPGQAQRRECGADKAKALPFLAPFANLAGQVPKLNLAHPDAGFVAVERNGRWFVSPTRTLLDDLTAVLKVFDRSDLDRMADYVRQFLGGAIGGSQTFSQGTSLSTG